MPEPIDESPIVSAVTVWLARQFEGQNGLDPMRSRFTQPELFDALREIARRAIEDLSAEESTHIVEVLPDGLGRLDTHLSRSELDELKNWSIHKGLEGNTTELIAKYLMGNFERETGVNLAADQMASSRVYEAAEKAKHELERRPQVIVELPFIWADERGPLHLEMKLDWFLYEELQER